MAKKLHTHLSRRETQVMDIVYRLGEATVGDVLDALPDPPGYNSVRVILGILEDKRFLKHHREGSRYVYTPRVPRDRAKRSVLEHVLETFFEGSAPKAVATLIDMSASKLDARELDELSAMIRKAKTRRSR